MKALVARLTGKFKEGDPINIHVTVFWATILFWTLASLGFVLLRMLT
jgi:hypothetical protein